MNSFFKITQALKTELTTQGFNVVTLGDTFKVDIARQTIFPYAHIVPGGFVKQGKITEWDFKIIAMDIVDFNKDDLRDEAEPFYSTDNMQDVLNDIANRLSQVIEQFQRGQYWDEYLRVTDDVGGDSFTERFENLLAGWELDVTIQAPNNGSIC